MTQQKTNIWAINLFGIALYAILFSGSTFALPLLAADMPCVKEVCIGDDLSKLHGIKFQNDKNSQPNILNKKC